VETIHCKYCEYYHEEDDGWGLKEIVCQHPSNVVTKKNWRTLWKHYKRSPRWLNKKMDCPNFVHRDKDLQAAGIATTTDRL
jgi:hypothetical protein